LIQIEMLNAGCLRDSSEHPNFAVIDWSR